MPQMCDLITWWLLQVTDIHDQGCTRFLNVLSATLKFFVRRLECSWNLMAHSDAQEGKWRGNWRMEWVASTLHSTLEHGVSSITTTDAHTSAARSRLNWCPCRFKWTCPLHRKTKSGFCTCAITFQTQSNKKPVPCWGTTNTEHYCTKSSYLCNMAPMICASLSIIVILVIFFACL
jgi:hypothetical protein